MRKLSWMVFIMILCLCTSASAEVVFTPVTQAENALVEADDHGLWVVANGDVSYWPDYGAGVSLGKVADVTHIAADGDFLCLLTEKEGTYTLHKMSSDGQMKHIGRLPQGFYVHQLAVEEDRVYLLGLAEGYTGKGIPRSMCVYTGQMAPEMKFELLPADGWKNVRIGIIDVEEGMLYAKRLQTLLAITLPEGTLAAQKKLEDNIVSIAGQKEDGQDFVYVMQGLEMHKQSLTWGGYPSLKVPVSKDRYILDIRRSTDCVYVLTLPGYRIFRLDGIRE